MSIDLKRAREIAKRLNTEAASLIRSLCDIVEKLPVTADGVPITPGMEVWCHRSANASDEARGTFRSFLGNEEIIHGIVAYIGALGSDAQRCAICQHFSSFTVPVKAVDLYSTREAALAAAGKEKAPTPPTMPR